MTISEVSLDALNRFAAERLNMAHRHTVSHDEQQAEQSDLCDRCGVARHSHEQHLPDLTQPAGMKMLLERMTQQYGLSVAFEKISKQYAPMAVYDLARAILEAFVISEGFQVEGA